MTPARGPVRPATRGPIVLLLELGIGLVFVALFAWFIGVVIEIAGSYTLWKDEGEAHAQRLVREDLEHIAAAPRSILVGDTIAFSHRVIQLIEMPYRKLGIIKWYLGHHGPQAREQVDPSRGGTGNKILQRGIGNATASLSRTFSRVAIVSMLIAQDVLLRMSVAVFALPAFVLACLLGAIDGLVRRDLRRWGGGRESSFVYHHAKRYTAWAMTGGFGLYLSWPFGGFNPAYMVLVFSVLVAASLSTTVAAFKKYV